MDPVLTGVMGFETAARPNPDEPHSTLRTFPAFSPSGRLDRIYYRGGFELIRAQTSDLRESRVASDHLPIIADLNLRHVA